MLVYNQYSALRSYVLVWQIEMCFPQEHVLYLRHLSSSNAWNPFVNYWTWMILLINWLEKTWQFSLSFAAYWAISLKIRLYVTIFQQRATIESFNSIFDIHFRFAKEIIFFILLVCMFYIKSLLIISQLLLTSWHWICSTCCRSRLMINTGHF